LIDYEKTSPLYIVLESLPFDKNSSRMIHVLSPTPEYLEFKLGRGHDSDVRVSDISVSRIHAFIAYREGKFYLQDNHSKFGTLKLL
jgi:hypothetical protein